jgi:hypothetical protein
LLAESVLVVVGHCCARNYRSAAGRWHDHGNDRTELLLDKFRQITASHESDHEMDKVPISSSRKAEQG